MLRTICILWLVLAYTPLVAQSNRLDVQVDQVPLSQLLEQLEEQEGFLFSFQPDDIRGIVVSLQLNKTTIEEVCQALETQTGLAFRVLSLPYIVISQETVSANSPQSRFLRGRVFDQMTEVPLVYATVYLQSAMIGGYTDAKGRFELEIPIEVADTLVISYTGYEAVKHAIQPEATYSDFEVRLPYFSFSEDWVVITDYLTDGIDMGAQQASTTLKPVPIGALPGQSEPDVLQTIQFLPGVSSPDGGAANLHIRGSTPDHNLILWEDIPVYQNAHLFGMVSAFNPYILEKVDVYRGGFGAEYGGRIAGLIDLRSPDETLEDSDWGVGLNSTHGYAYGNLAFGPKQNFGLVFSARHSLTDFWTSPIQNQSTFRTQIAPLFDKVDWEDIPTGIGLNDEYGFSDVNLKFSWAINEHHRITVAGFASQSDFTNTIIDDLRPIQQEEAQEENNRGLKASWKATWGDRWRSDTYVLNSEYNYSYDILLRPQDGVEMGPLNEGERRNSLSEWQAKTTLTFAGPWGHTLEGGYQFTHYEVDFSVLSYRRNVDSVSTVDMEVIGNHGVFLTLTGDPEKKLGYELGVRANSQTQGSNIFWEPRLRLWYQPNDHWTFQVHSGRYFQFISQVTQFAGEEFGMLTPMWRLNGGKSDPILKSWQHQLGFIYNKNGWVLDVQAYLKRSKGISLLSLADIQTLGKKFFIGDAQAEGIDLLLKKRIKRYRTWVSYSLGSTEFLFPNFFDKTFAAPYDIRHQINWVHLWQAGAWELSAGWKYQTGLPFSEPEALMMDPMGLFRLRYEEINGSRLPAQHQLDLSVVYQFHPSARQHWQGWAGISFLNIYNRRNVYYRGYYHFGRMGEMRQIGFLEKSQLGFTPNAVLRFQF